MFIVSLELQTDNFAINVVVHFWQESHARTIAEETLLVLE